MRLGVLFICLIGVATPSLAEYDSPYLRWVAANSPDGFDITPDGTIWINIGKPGNKSDYAIRAEDLQKARDTKDRYPSFWTRGYHRRNPSLKYRETKTRMSLDCQREKLTVMTAAYYDAAGSLLYRTGLEATSDVIPGTYGEQYYRKFCIQTDPPAQP